MDDPDLLYNLAVSCEELFDTPVLASSGRHNAIVQQWTEYQQRFAIWASQLGVFARRSQSLDTRLRKVPHVQDLVARLLDALRRSLSQFARAQVHVELSEDEKNSEEVSELQQSALLTTIDEALKRLNRLGVDIRQASRGKINTKVQEFASRLDLLPALALSQAAIESLYPGAHESLKAHLCQGMMDIYARIRFLGHRQEELETRRPVALAPPMQPIRENEPMETETSTAETTNEAPRQPPTAKPLPSPLPLDSDFPSQSGLSTIDTFQMRQRLSRHLHLADTNPNTEHKTSSVQIQQTNYPRPYLAQDENLFKCEWCSEPFDKRTLSESKWRRHIDSDLKPYRCMMENCADGHPSFASFDEWSQHMNGHSRLWYQRTFLTQGWGCAVCDFDGIYPEPGALLSHLEEAHSDQFTTDQLHTISRQRVIQRPRSWNECLLCCFAVDEVTDPNHPSLPKRHKAHSQPLSVKMARTARETKIMVGQTDSGLVEGASSDSGDSDDSADSDRGIPAPDAPNNTKIMARHIAAHSQALMLLTIRFASLLSMSDVSNGDGYADSVNIDRSDTTNSVGEILRSRSLPSMTTSDDSPLNTDDIVPDYDSLPDATVDLRRLLGLPGGFDDAGGVDERYPQHRDPIRTEADRVHKGEFPRLEVEEEVEALRVKERIGERPEHATSHANANPFTDVQTSPSSFHESVKKHIRHIYDDIRNGDTLLSHEKFKAFLRETQRVGWISPNHRDHKSFNFDEFFWLWRHNGSAWRAAGEMRQVDATHPITHYFINSSHKTYFEGNQLSSGSSADAYRTVSSASKSGTQTITDHGGRC